MQFGRLLFEAGRFRDARAFLEQARPGEEEEKIERLFLLGLVEARLGYLPEAAERFESILAVRPDLTRVRLELARVYGLLGRDEKARFHFEATLADELPSSVEDAVETWLDRIDARKRWSVSASAAILPESNPAKRTDDEEVRIGGVPFRLDEDAREASGTGLLFSTGAQYSPVLADDWRGVLAVSAAAKLYEQSDWNDISVQSDIGIARLFDRGSASGGMRLGRRWLDADRYSDGIGPWMRGRLRLSPALRIDAALSAERRDHPQHRGLDGWTVTFGPGLDYALNSQTTLRAELDLEHVEAREDRHGSRLVGLAFGVSHAFEGGLSVSPRGAVHWRRHADRNPLFGKTRSDRQMRLSVNLLHRALRYRGFAPHVGFFVEWNRSSIPVNSYSNRGGVFGVSKTF
ncbi:MAG: surface lipoprotein assembly modifier [Alphaproteobacteria bacterium]|nr:surface lipoprotein assembly modifier [Alphaproteobacteria bacterium]